MTNILIRNGVIIDGNGGTPITNGAILVEGNKIHEVGPYGNINIPDKTKTIDAQGGYILPGFIDCHVHLLLEFFDVIERINTPISLPYYQAIDRMSRTLNAGITSVRDAGGVDLGVKQAVDNGLIQGPRIQISIIPLTTTGGLMDWWMYSGNEFEIFPSHPGRPHGRCDGMDGVRKKVREVLRAGAEVIKVCATGGCQSPTGDSEDVQFSPEELAIMVEEGNFRQRKAKVMAHAIGLQGIKNAIISGIHSIEHGCYLDNEAIDLMLQRGTYLVPTLLGPFTSLEPGRVREATSEWALKKIRELFDAHRESVAKAYQSGVKIAMGTDAGVMPHGTNMHELALLCDIGMKPMEAIMSTTKIAAECLGWQDQLGTLEHGKLADLVVCKTDPLDDIRSIENIENIVFVMKDGQVIKNLL